MITEFSIVSLVLAVFGIITLAVPSSVANEPERDTGAQAIVDSLESLRQSLQSQLVEVEEELDIARSQVLLAHVRSDSSISIPAKVIAVGGVLRQNSEPGAEDASVPGRAEVLIQGASEGYLLVRIENQVGYMDPVYLEMDETVHELVTALIEEDIRIRAEENRRRTEETLLIAQAEAEERYRAALALEAEQERQAQVEAEEADRLEQEERAHAEAERAERIRGLYSEPIATRIIKREIWIGMSDHMARRSIGEPNDINRTVSARGVREQWVYRYRDILLYFDDGILTAWQD